MVWSCFFPVEAILGWLRKYVCWGGDGGNKQGDWCRRMGPLGEELSPKVFFFKKYSMNGHFGQMSYFFVSELFSFFFCGTFQKKEGIRLGSFHFERFRRRMCGIQSEKNNCVWYLSTVVQWPRFPAISLDLPFRKINISIPTRMRAEWEGATCVMSKPRLKTTPGDGPWFYSKTANTLKNNFI